MVNFKYMKTIFIVLFLFLFVFSVKDSYSETVNLTPTLSIQNNAGLYSHLQSQSEVAYNNLNLLSNTYGAYNNICVIEPNGRYERIGKLDKWVYIPASGSVVCYEKDHYIGYLTKTPPEWYLAEANLAKIVQLNWEQFNGSFMTLNNISQSLMNMSLNVPSKVSFTDFTNDIVKTNNIDSVVSSLISTSLGEASYNNQLVSQTLSAPIKILAQQVSSLQSLSTLTPSQEKELTNDTNDLKEMESSIQSAQSISGLGDIISEYGYNGEYFSCSNYSNVPNVDSLSNLPVFTPVMYLSDYEEAISQLPALGNGNSGYMNSIINYMQNFPTYSLNSSNNTVEQSTTNLYNNGLSDCSSPYNGYYAIGYYSSPRYNRNSFSYMNSGYAIPGLSMKTLINFGMSFANMIYKDATIELNTFN